MAARAGRQMAVGHKETVLEGISGFLLWMEA